MHQHRNEEIISWVPKGVMRHDDRQGNELVTDPDHLMVMNAESGFWYAEETLADDPPLRMLQIFVRPHSPDLVPDIQHEPIPDSVTGEWRHLFGPEGIRNHSGERLVPTMNQRSAGLLHAQEVRLLQQEL